jgi:uncharacterized protein with HEPN domain
MMTRWDAVDLDILWNIVLDDLPPLVKQIEVVIGQIKS